MVTPPAALAAHPSTPGGAVRGLGARARTEGTGILVLRYSLDADMSRIRVPPSGAGGRAEQLWKHTCFEAFVAPAAGTGYHEFNFSPALDWAIYRFSAYREGMSPAEIGKAPGISVRRMDDGLELESTVCLADLAGLRDARRLRVGLAAVIEEENGRLSYWGLRHPPGKPDFHHSDGFALEVLCS
jgi:hypothetical protein